MTTPQPLCTVGAEYATVADSGGSGASPIHPPPIAIFPAGHSASELPTAQMPAPKAHITVTGAGT